MKFKDIINEYEDSFGKSGKIGKMLQFKTK